MTQSPVPGDGGGTWGPGNGRRPDTLPPQWTPVHDRRVQVPDRTAASVNLSLIVLVTVFLAFVLLSAKLLDVTAGRSLQVAGIATAIAGLAVHGKSMLLAIGRRLFTDANGRGTP